MNTLLLSFDLEEFDALKRYGLDPDEKKMYAVSGEGLRVLLGALDEVGGVRASFFTTANFALAFPGLVRELSSRGHEVGLHGLSHEDNYALLTPEQSEERLGRAKRAVEKVSGRPVFGFRPPRLFGPGPEVLRRLGLVYDSSLHPTYIPGRYNHFFESRKARWTGPLVEVPVSVTPLARLPFTWMFFRNMPLLYSRLCTLAAVRGTGYVNIYFHPWEFVDLTAYGRMPRVITRKTGRPLVEKLQNYLFWLKSRGFRSLTMADYVRAEFPATAAAGLLDTPPGDRQNRSASNKEDIDTGSRIGGGRPSSRPTRGSRFR